MKICKIVTGIILGTVLFSSLTYSEESFQVISIPKNRLIGYNRPSSISEIIRMATDLSRNEKTIFIYSVKEELADKLLLDKEPLISSMDIKSIDISCGRIRIQFHKKPLAKLNDALGKKVPAGHPAQVVIAYKGALYFAPYVILPAGETAGLSRPNWLPPEIFNWP